MQLGRFRFFLRASASPRELHSPSKWTLKLRQRRKLPVAR